MSRIRIELVALNNNTKPQDEVEIETCLVEIEQTPRAKKWNLKIILQKTQIRTRPDKTDARPEPRTK